MGVIISLLHVANSAKSNCIFYRTRINRTHTLFRTGTHSRSLMFWCFWCLSSFRDGNRFVSFVNYSLPGQA